MERLRTGFIEGSQFVAEFELPDSKTIRHLRGILVATGALPPRDEHMIRLEHWITAIIAGRDDPGERQLLHRYAIWHALRRLRRCAGGQHVTHGQAITSSGTSGPLDAEPGDLLQDLLAAGGRQRTAHRCGGGYGR